MSEDRPKKKESITAILIHAVDEICDNYCKYPDMMISKDPESDPDILEDMLYEQYCANCPLNRLV